MQQPFEQYVLGPQTPPAPHTVVPLGQVAVPPQLVGSVLGSWPGHRMQVVPPHSSLPHAVFFVQGRQAVGSARFVSSQFGEAEGLVRMS